jgi:hypothetical protein
VSSQGLLLVGLGFSAARDDLRWAEPAFWAGLLLIYLPVVAGLLTRQLQRGEALTLVGGLGLLLYLIKYMHSPLAFAMHDEFLHWRTASDILNSGRLFQDNPMLPASPLYPALEICTSAVVMLTGLPIFESGLIVVGIGRVMFLLALFLFFERIAASTRLGALSTVLYMTNPHFLFFDAQFSYESLAVPFVGVVGFLLISRQRAGRATRLALTAAAFLATGVVVTAHHVTALALSGFLAIWSLTTNVLFRLRARRGPGGMALLTLVAILGWMVFVAYLTADYLKPLFVDGVLELVHIVTGESAGRVPFQSTTGEVSALWERIVGLSSVVLILAALPVGLLQVWRRHRSSPPAWALAITALGYPAMLLLRFTSAGADLSSRASAFLYVGLAFVLALAVRRLSQGSAWRSPLLLSCVGVLFVGGVILSWPPWARLPWPYRPNADSRSIDLVGTASAVWTREYLGSGHRFASDLTNRLFLLTYGQQRLVTQLSDKVGVYPLFMSRRIAEPEQAILLRGEIEYVTLDYRLANGKPMARVYEGSNELAAVAQSPIDPLAFQKFDALPSISRIYDSGSIVYFDVRGFTRDR